MANGKKPYVVVSGRLKVRRASGKLADYIDKRGADLDTLFNNISMSTSHIGHLREVKRAPCGEVK